MSRVELVRLSKTVYDSLSMLAQLEALSSLLRHCDRVRYVTKQGRYARLMCVFDDIEKFHLWNDIYHSSGLCYAQSRTIVGGLCLIFPIESLFRDLVDSSKWLVNNRDGLGTDVI